MKIWLLFKTNEIDNEIPVAFLSKKKMQKYAVNYIKENFNLYNKSEYWTKEEDIESFLTFNTADLCWACKIKVNDQMILQ